MIIEIEIESKEKGLMEKYKGLTFSQCNEIPICENTRIWSGEIEIGPPIKAKQVLKIHDEVNNFDIVLYKTTTENSIDIR